MKYIVGMKVIVHNMNGIIISADHYEDMYLIKLQNNKIIEALVEKIKKIK